jgi:hypothetical protein
MDEGEYKKTEAAFVRLIASLRSAPDRMPSGRRDDRRALRAADYSGEFAAAALDGLVGDWSVMRCRRWQAPG